MKTKNLTAEVQRLTWELLDKCATAGQIARLEKLLMKSSAARQAYVTCMQMHTDMRFLVGGGQRLLTDTLAKAGVPIATAMPSATAAENHRRHAA